MYFLTCSTRASVALAASTARSTSASTAGFAVSSANEPSRPLAAAKPVTPSSSSTISAVRYERWSPIATAWPMIGDCALTRFSTIAGAMFLPAALMMISFLRSTIL